MVESFQIESASISDRGLSEKRPQNEDSFLEIPKCGIFAVADGVGGAQAGDVASQMAMEILGEAFTNASEVADAEQVMSVALERANSAIHQMSTELPQLASMATTVVALHLAGNIATIGHVGDSRLYRLDADGSLYRETDDHSMVFEEVKAGRMTEEQADNHPGKNIISRALGAEPTVSIDLKTMLVAANTTFLICSDGVTRHIAETEIGELLRSGADPADICSRIKEICFERGAEDNLTAVVVRVAPTEQVRPSESGEYPSVYEVPTIADLEEPTIATARPSVESAFFDDPDDDELLELDTAEIYRPTVENSVTETPFSNELAVPDVYADSREFSEVESGEQFAASSVSGLIDEQVAPFQAGESVSVDHSTADKHPAEEFSMFGNSGIPERQASSGSFGKIASMAGLLLLGSIFGLGAYHFFIAPAKSVETLPITEMRTGNIPLSFYEENRRNVDKDPAGYIAKFGAAPENCEDYYLLGRAHLLNGDIVKSKAALLEARNRLSTADPVNAKTLLNDIAVAMAIINDPAAQEALKKELGTPVVASSPGVNTNSATGR